MPYTEQNVGYQYTDTSQAAAEAVSAETIRANVFTLLADGRGYTTDEAAAFLGYDRYSVRPRFTELRDSGLIVQTDERRQNRSGRYAIVWRIAQ